MITLRKILLITSAAICLSCTATQASVVTTLPGFPSSPATPWNGSSFVQTWGNTTGVPTYGQTFVMPMGDAFLNSFEFEVKNNSGPGIPINFFAVVYAWTGSDISGFLPAYAQQFTISAEPTPNAFQHVVANTLNTPLNPGSQYVAIFTLDFSNNSPNSVGASFGALTTSGYSQGQFVFNPTSSLNGGWNTSLTTTDLAFKFNFSPLVNPVATPEPATAAMAAIALLCVGGRAGYRRLRSAS